MSAGPGFSGHLRRLAAHRGLRWGLGLFLALTGSFVAWANHVVPAHSAGRIYSDIQVVPARVVALVLGANPSLPDGRRNRFFDFRMDTAAALWHAGKARILLVSGDNGTDHYDEVTHMRASLISRGVPASVIVRDHAGFRTLDSVVRCATVFGVHRPLIVSQRWHVERALYLADHRGVDAIGVAAADLDQVDAPRTHIREYFARAKAVLDVELLGTQPRFPGPPQPIRSDAPSTIP